MLQSLTRIGTTIMNRNKIDILAFGAHPDDVECAAAGVLLKHIAMGKTVAIVDLTAGEMGMPSLRSTISMYGFSKSSNYIFC